MNKDLCKALSTVKFRKLEETGPYLSALLTVGQLAQSLRSKTGDHCTEFMNPNQILPVVEQVMKSYQEMRKNK